MHTRKPKEARDRNHHVPGYLYQRVHHAVQSLIL